jgi:hypothetical protein
MGFHASAVLATPQPTAELDRLGDEIAELSAHLDAATARLLTLIREFDARGGWNTGFRSCADWLGWRVGLDIGAARERVRVARALGTLPVLAQALANAEPGSSRWAAQAQPPTSSASFAAGGGWIFWRRRPWLSSRRMPWRWWRSRRCTAVSIPVRRASAIRSSSMSTLRCWRTPDSRGSQRWRTAPTFPRKRRDDSPVTPAA